MSSMAQDHSLSNWRRHL